MTRCQNYKFLGKMSFGNSPLMYFNGHLLAQAQIKPKFMTINLFRVIIFMPEDAHQGSEERKSY